MPTAEDRAADLAVILEIKSDPDKWVAGHACDHCSEVTNSRTSDIHDVTVISKALYARVEFVGASSPPDGSMPGATYFVHTVINSGCTGPERYPLHEVTVANPPGGSRPARSDKIQTTAAYIDATNLSSPVEENLKATYTIAIP